MALSWALLAQSCWKDTTCSSITQQAFPGIWESNIYAPSSRTVAPKNVLSLATGDVISAYKPNAHTLSGNGSALVFDFGLEVGGLVTLKYTVSSTSTSPAGAVGLAFTEAKNWIGQWSDSSNGAFKGPDGALYSNFSGPGSVSYTMPDEKLRGGFRYLTLFLTTSDPTAPISVQLSSISLEIGFQPTWSNLRAYQGYFHSNDETLNKIWYSGAYTLQTNAVPPNTGRKASPMATSGWLNNGTLGPGDTIIVDGAKRDRAVWPGDMGVAVPSAFVSIGDLESVRNALQVMYDYQNADGSFPEAGPPLLQQGSDTYHMWTMIGTYNYLLYTNDTSFLSLNFPKYLKAMNYIYSKVGPSGLLNVTGLRDWARWQTGFNMSEAQMILYRTLTTGSSLALWVSPPDTSLSALWLSRASALQNSTIRHCYDPSYGAFKDNATATTLHPQDANSLSIYFSLVSPTSPLTQSISTQLLKNWTPIGAETPELPGNISPFISSFEIGAHLAAGQTARALELIRRSWGWYLANPNGTQSTVVEGYLVNGTFGYRWSRGYGNDFSYVSHSHGWSSGPTSALTEYVLGLQVTGRAGSTWRFAPQFGDLTDVQGGFTTTLGKFRAHWTTTPTPIHKRNTKDTKGGGGYSATVNTPSGTTGQLILPVPVQGQKPKVTVDGKVVCTQWYRRSDAVGDLVLVDGVAGGSHTIQVS
ncbi:Six-hairpin glycosidase-like protein [Diplogelasinospora grovesii]|uniref:Six-hairpin glycosidase-like protein n=1 Tax=Diplogelasinospora grovesii TaxID=303347 RepID=A0AAN6NA57_9PEZI|nr:Six-hairpin glycosidase-like protein [Diplogelasinospora grovesii]